MSFTEATWPLACGDEITHEHFEDVRKWIWLLRNRWAGNFDATVYGGYTYANWEGSWGEGEEPVHNPGDLIVAYTPFEGEEDLYQNKNQMTEGQVHDNPPLDGEGDLNAHWVRYPNPNIYHHWDFNSGRKIVVHLEWASFDEYTVVTDACDWLPRQTDPMEQLPPYVSPPTQRYLPVEFAKAHITNDIGTNYERTHPSNADPDDRPAKVSEYAKWDGHPGSPGQARYEVKMNQAYQDQVIFTVEHEYHYLRKVDDTYIEYWSYQMCQNKDAWEEDTSYGKGDIAHDGEGEPTYYICIRGHNSGSEEGEDLIPLGDTGYWETPVYQPLWLGSHPIYDNWGGEYFACNGSAFERLLKECDSYDWRWDGSYPYTPLWILDQHEEGPNSDWPKAQGCWRRTWKHSMGRVGSYMLPREAGSPFDLFSLDPWKLCVDQDTYDDIPSANRFRYQVVNEAAMLAAVEDKLEEIYTGSTTYEDLLVQRHDPVQTEGSTAQYELHHQLVNDLYCVITQMEYVDDYGINIEAKYRVRIGDDPHLSSGAAASSNWKSTTDADEPYDGNNLGLMGYGCWVEAFWQGGSIFEYQTSLELSDPSKKFFWFRVTESIQGIAGFLNISKAYIRLQNWSVFLGNMYNVEDTLIGIYDACTIGFEGGTISAWYYGNDVYDIYKTQYSELQLDYWDGTNWDFFSTLVDDWFDVGEDSHFDWEASLPYNLTRYRYRYINLGYDYNEMHNAAVFGITWSEVPEDVWDLDWTNAIDE